MMSLMTLLELEESVPTADLGIRFFNSCKRNESQKKELILHESYPDDYIKLELIYSSNLIDFMSEKNII